MSSRTIVSGEEVLLYLNERKSWVVKIEEGKKFHSHRGIVDLGELVGKPYGYDVRSTLGATLKAMPADYLDHLERIARRTQVIYPKDMAYIALMANVRSGSRVLECGTGIFKESSSPRFAFLPPTRATSLLRRASR